MSYKRNKAVALRYDSEKDFAPVVSATGKGLVAEKIITKANDHQIPIVEDQTLVELLAELDINEKIPEDLYEAVAEVFAFIYQTDQKINAKHKV